MIFCRTLKQGVQRSHWQYGTNTICVLNRHSQADVCFNGSDLNKPLIIIMLDTPT